MVISQIIGGLGNQMFQFAAGRALSLRNQSELILDVSGFKGYKLHQGFELQRIFIHPFEMASKADVGSVLGWQSAKIVRRIMSRSPFSSFCCKGYVIEPHFHYWSEIANVKKDCYLSGYWQSEKYFSDAISQIRTDFTFRLPLEGKNVELAKQISQVSAVSLHVRRGDYFNNPKTTATHGLCTLDYYRASIRYIAERVQLPHFFIFSDDIDWVQNNLEIDFPCIYVRHNHGAESYNDMYLMSLCRHHIIANSSFSWWGAWLNPSLEKIVIAPQKWFANQAVTNDLFPTGWVTL